MAVHDISRLIEKIAIREPRTMGAVEAMSAQLFSSLRPRITIRISASAWRQSPKQRAKETGIAARTAPPVNASEIPRASDSPESKAA